MAYVQLVYGRQLKRPEEEQPADPLAVNAVTRDERDALKRSWCAGILGGVGRKVRASRPARNSRERSPG